MRASIRCLLIVLACLLSWSIELACSKLTTFDPESLGIRLHLDSRHDSNPLDEVLYLFKKHHIKKAMFRNSQWKDVEEKLRNLPSKDQAIMTLLGIVRDPHAKYHTKEKMFKLFESVNSIGLEWGMQVQRAMYPRELGSAAVFSLSLVIRCLGRIVASPSVIIGLSTLAAFAILKLPHQYLQRAILITAFLIPSLALALTVMIACPIEIIEVHGTSVLHCGDRMISLNRWLSPLLPLIFTQNFLSGLSFSANGLSPTLDHEGNDEVVSPQSPIVAVRRLDDNRYAIVQDNLTLDYYHRPQIHGQLLLQQPSIGYLRLADFNDRSDEDFQYACEELTGSIQSSSQSSNVLRGLVVDLRGNTGGSLAQALDIAARFLPKGTTLLQISDTFWFCNEKSLNTHADVSIALLLLVDSVTASAAEVLCEALSANKRATVLGTTTFGKNTAQVLMALSDNSGICFTIKEFRGPSGRSLEGGIRPHFELKGEVIDVGQILFDEMQRKWTYKGHAI